MKKTPPPLHLPPDMGHVSAKRRRLFFLPRGLTPFLSSLATRTRHLRSPPPSLFALPLPHEKEEAKNLAGKGQKN